MNKKLENLSKMSADEILEKFKNSRDGLDKIIQDLNTEYYTNGNESCSNNTYDKLFEVAKKLKTETSKKVGSECDKRFKKIKHPFPMLSLNKVTSFEKLEKFFDNSIEKLHALFLNFTCSPKLDGIALELVYEDYKLVSASTRGDGVVGEDVFQNVLQISGVKRTLHESKPNYILRGEVVVSKENFKEINNSLDECDRYTSPRSMASGFVRGGHKLSEKLNFVVYAGWEDWYGYRCENWENFADFEGFVSVRSLMGSKVTSDYQTIQQLCEDFQNIKNCSKFEIDGIVIHISDTEGRRKLGSTARAPRWAVAWKPADEVHYTKIKDVTFQVGRTGLITPVAEIEPVVINGSLVSRATLHDIEYYCIGDKVGIVLGGGVIPKLIFAVEFDRNGSEKTIVFPKKCPSCDKKLCFNRCINKDCKEIVFRRLVHFASKGAFNIRGLGSSEIYKLFEAKKCCKFSDFFKLKKEDFSRNGAKIFENIQLSKKIPLKNFIYALSIPYFKERDYKKIDQLYGSFDGFTLHMRSSDNYDIENLKKVGLEVLDCDLLEASKK